jgi:hypothetical protein
MTDFNTIYQQTFQKLTLLQSEVAELEDQIKLQTTLKIKKDKDDVQSVIEKANLEANKTDVEAVDYVSKIKLDISEINPKSIFNVLKTLLKI